MSRKRNQKKNQTKPVEQKDVQTKETKETAEVKAEESAEKKETPKVEEKAEIKDTKKPEEKTENKQNSSKNSKRYKKNRKNTEKQSESKDEKKAEEKAEVKEETKTEEKKEEKSEKKAEAKEESKTEDKKEEKSEKKSETKEEPKTEDKKEEKSEKKSETKEETKTEEKKEEKSEEKAESKEESKAEDKKEENSEDKKEEKKDETTKVYTKEDAKNLTKEQAELVSEKDKKKAEKAEKDTKGDFPIWLRVILIAAGVLLLCYLGGAAYFSTHFMPATTLNGIDVSGKSETAAEQAIHDVIEEYDLTIRTRGGKIETIKGSDIDMEMTIVGTIKDEIREQNPFAWPIDSWFLKEQSIDANVKYDSAKLIQAVNSLDCMQSKNQKAPREPEIVRKNSEFSVKDGDEGCSLISTDVRSAVKKCVLNVNGTLDLEDAGCYRTLKYKSDDKKIEKALDYLNKIKDLSIVYKFNEEDVVLDGKTMARWAKIGNDYEVTFDEEQINDYVKKLQEEHEMRGQVINFHTSYDRSVEVTSYIRSNDLNTEVEKQEIVDFLERSKKSSQQTMEREASEMASVGDTYIEINLTSQHMYCYKDGKMILESDVVTGCPARGMATPAGVYTIFKHASPATLVGDTYRTTVSYWMPFNGGIGLHDATWQPRFGGSWYLGNGSHGCVNLPLSVAKFVYQNYTIGDKVVCYHLEGTESTSYSDAKGDPITTEATTEATTEKATEAATEAQEEETTESSEE